MTALGLLGELYRLGVTLAVEGGRLRVRAPRGVITEDMRQRLAEHKPEIVEALGEGSFPDPTLPDELLVPSGVKNTNEAVRACINSQRRRPAA